MAKRSSSPGSSKANVVMFAALVLLGLALVISRRGGEDPGQPLVVAGGGQDTGVPENAAPDGSAESRLVAADQRREYLSPPPRSEARDPNRLLRLSAALRDAERLWATAQSESLALPEAQPDSGRDSTAARAAATQWKAWSQGWTGRIDRFGDQLGRLEGSLGVDDPAYQIFRQISAFASDLRSLAVNPLSDGSVPLIAWRRSRLDAARRRLDQADLELTVLIRR